MVSIFANGEHRGQDDSVVTPSEAGIGGADAPRSKTGAAILLGKAWREEIYWWAGALGLTVVPNEDKNLED